MMIGGSALKRILSCMMTVAMPVLLMQTAFAESAGSPSPEEVSQAEPAPQVEPAPKAEIVPDTEPALQAEAAPEPEPAPDTEKKLPTADEIDHKVDEFFSPKKHRLWQFIKPNFLLRTGFYHEQFDETNQILRQSRFKVFDAQFGFAGSLDKYRVAKEWYFLLDYKVKGHFAPSVAPGDAYLSAELHNFWFSPRFKMGVMKVPFLHSELEDDKGLYFFDRPQYVSPYGNWYYSDMVPIGLGRHAGASMRFGFFDNAWTIEGGMFSNLEKPEQEHWENSVLAVRTEFSSKDWIHERVRLEAGAGYYYQEQLPWRIVNSRSAVAADLRVYAYGAFVGGEWAMQTMDDVFHKTEYEGQNYSNTWTRAMGYQVFAGYSFPKRRYELALRYQWYDPDDTNLQPPLPEYANQGRRWITAAASWWPINLVRLMLNYTHKMELEASETETYSEHRLKNVSNDEVQFYVQIAL